MCSTVHVCELCTVRACSSKLLRSSLLTVRLILAIQHLRMSVNPNGSCQMQHLSFSRVSEMLDYFKHHPIPLESTSMYGDIMLTDHVPSNESADVRADYDAFQQARSNASLRGRAQSFTATSISDPPHLTLRINGRPISRATENIYIRT